MKTFYEFVDHKKLEASIIEAANLMVEMNIDPQTFMLERVSKDLGVELDEGFLDTIRNIGSGIKQFGQNVWSGGGVTGGWAQAKDTVMGPGAKFDSAVNSITSLIDALEKNDQTKNMMNASGKQNLAKWMGVILNTLKKERDAIPRMQPASNKPQYGQKSGTPAGGTPAGGTPAGGAPAGGAPAGGAPAGGAPAGGPSPPPSP